MMSKEAGLAKFGKPSFRDMVIGYSNDTVLAKDIHDLDVEIQEDDVVMSSTDGIPTIDFFERVHALIDSKLVNSVIVRLLGRSIGYAALLSRIKTLWNLRGEVALIDLDNDYFLVRFAESEDCSQVLTGGPWLIYGCYLTVQPWSRDFSTLLDHLEKIVVWVCLPGLPYRYYTKSMFRYIAGTVGEIVQIDYNTEEGKRGRFSRLANVVNLKKPLVSSIIIDGQRQGIEYEGFPTIFYSCGKYGHIMETCKPFNEQNHHEDIIDMTIVESTEKFGPWMQAPTRRSRKNVNNREPTDRTVAYMKQSLPVKKGRYEVLLSEKDDDYGLQTDNMVKKSTTPIKINGLTAKIDSSKKGSNVDWETMGSVRGKEVVMVQENQGISRQTNMVLLKGSNSGSKGDQLIEKSIGKEEQGVKLIDIPIPTDVISTGVIVPVQTKLKPSHHSTVTVIPRDTITSGDGVRKLGKWENMDQGRVVLDRRFSRVKGSGHRSPYSSRRKPPEKHEAREKDKIDIDNEIGTEVHWRDNTIFGGGALTPEFNIYLKNIVRTQNPDVVGLMEPRISGRKADAFISRHGFSSSYRVEANGFVGGIWIMWKENISLDVIAVSNQFIHSICVDRHSENTTLLTLVYASLVNGKRRELWSQLLVLKPVVHVPWILGGDFNAILNSDERMGGAIRRAMPCRRFSAFIEEAELFDLDHRPVLLVGLAAKSTKSSTHFRYLTAWQDNPSFVGMLQSVWNSQGDVLVNLTTFSNAAVNWNKDVFGHIGKRKSQLLARIRGIKKAVEFASDAHLQELELA
ncbi:hypothetical protein GQ457_15G016510 [Hibiscus cannabinus]